MTDLIDRQTVLDLVKSVCKNELYKRKGPYDYQRQDYVFDYTPEVATILRLNKTIREAIIDLPSQYEETQSERVCRYIERKRKEEMGDLISRKEAYIILAEHYHLKTYIQQNALWEALNRVPDAEAFSISRGALKQSTADYIVYKRKWLYEHLETEFEILKGARDLEVKYGEEK